ncbi:MAG: hypothetical protein ACK5JD_07695, partial [Mangrovibacterium sp.]
MTEQEHKPSLASWYMPQEEMLEIRRRGKKITIGIPSDVAHVESRVPLTPEGVELLVSYGHEIYMETNAGKASNYSDEEYRNAGAMVLEKREEVFQCDVILRVSPFDQDDIDLLRGNQTL